MMEYLLIILAFSTGLLTIWNGSNAKKPAWIKKFRIQSILVVFLLLTAVFSLVNLTREKHKISEKEKSQENNYTTTLRIDTILSYTKDTINILYDLSSVNSDSIRMMLSKQESLIKDMNKYNNELSFISHETKNLINLQRKLNNNIRKQIEIDERLYEDERPSLIVKTNQIKFIDTLQYPKMKFTIENFGNRSATSVTYRGLIIYEDKKGNLYNHVNLPIGDGFKTDVPPVRANGNKNVYTGGLIDTTEYKNSKNRLIVIELNYIDNALSTKHKDTYFFHDRPNEFNKTIEMSEKLQDLVNKYIKINKINTNPFLKSTDM